ncbi:hypothetical protein [Ruminococcus sp.]|uniref:hypothetical protein n=1 Tax=Ruminococcus sp. TaxID=41978 RepID=UPI002E8072DE|nr:hypothetical protein [Ruminococcus sp.]MEE3492248.1 hypothetical protein [Ruminococcus sp.]
MKNTETQKQAPSTGKRVVKAIFNTIINILIVLVLLTSLFIAVISLTSKSTGISTIFGYTIQPIQSDSMKGGSPDGYGGKDFQKGDLVIAKATNFDPNAKYAAGDIITYKTQDTDGKDLLMSHRIVDAVEKDGVSRYQTWGDNREMAQVPDQSSVDEYLTASDIASLFYSSDYQGIVLKGWGAPIDFLKTQQGFFFVVLLPMIIFFMYALVRVVLSASNYRKSKAEDDKDEAVKAAVAAALAEKGVQPDDAQAVANTAAPAEPAAPAGMTAEQMEQFRQFQEFQKMQKAQQEAQDQPAQEAQNQQESAENKATSEAE